MRIKTVGDGPFVDFKIQGCEIEFGEGEISLNCQELQSDSEIRLNIFSTPNGLALGKGDNFVANVIIPPKNYREIDTGQKDDQGNPIMEREEIPLDPDQVTLNLWPYIK